MTRKLLVLHRLRGSRTYLVDPHKDKGPILTIDGFIPIEEIIQAGVGGIVKTSNGEQYAILPATPEDLHRIIARKSQIIYPKDLAIIAMLLDAKPCTRMLQSGVGTGYSLIYFARLLGPCGHIDGYEVRNDMITTARQNIQYLNLQDRITIYKADITKTTPTGCYDHALLDLPRPEDALPTIAPSLKPGAPIAVYTPTISQVERLAHHLQTTNQYIKTRTVEVNLREWQTRPGATRPTRQPIGHTGFITILYRIRGGCREDEH